MKRLLIIGCGDVAMRTIPLLVRRYRVFALLRNPAYSRAVRALGVMPLLGDLDDRASLARIAGIADAVLQFAPPRNSGTYDTRTRNLLSALSRGTLPQRLVYISTSGVYGDCRGARVSETHPLNAQTTRAQLRANAETQIRIWARRNRVTASILRVPGIYAPDRLPLSRLQQGTPCIIDSEDSCTNLIHADDLARIAKAALKNGAACRVPRQRRQPAEDGRISRQRGGCVRPAACPAYQPCRGSARVAGIAAVIHERIRRLSNQRMKRELKVKLRYPTVADGLAAVFRAPLEVVNYSQIYGR